MKIRIRNISYLILYIVAIFSFLKPSGFDLMGYTAANRFFNILRIVTALALFIIYFKKYKKIKKTLLAMILFFGIQILDYLIHGNDVMQSIIFSVSIIALFLLLDIAVEKGRALILLKAFTVNYIILLAYNLYFMIQNYGWKVGSTNTIYEKFSFLSSDNTTAGYIFGALYCALLLFRLSARGREKRTSAVLLISLVALCILNEIRLWSATALVGLFLFVVYILFALKKGISTKLILWTSIGLNIGVTFFRIHALFSKIIMQVLNKSINLTGRTAIWDDAIRKFLSSPLIGNGRDGIEGVKYIDNAILQILYRGGIPLLIAFCIFIVYAFRQGKVFSDKKSVLKSDAVYMLSIIIIMSIAESWNSFMGFYIIVMFISFIPIMEGNNTSRLIYERGQCEQQ